MSEEALLKYCIKEIEKVANRGDSLLWRNQDFIELSEKIYQKTQINISSDTLKRLFGKKKTYKEFANPQPSTKKALAKFLNYQDWDSFRTAIVYNPVIVEEPISEVFNEKKVETATDLKPNKQRKWLLPFLALLLLAILGLGVLGIYLHANKDTGSFKVSTSSGNVPLGVDFEYDISKATEGQYTLNFGHPTELFPLKENEVLLERKGQHVFESYRIPGLHTAKLKKDGKTLDSIPIYVKTNKKWYGMASDVIGHSALYLPHQESDGTIFFEPDFMASNGYAKSMNYCTEFRYFEPIPISGDNCKYFVRLKDDESTGGISCYDVLIFLVGDKGMFRIHFVEPGCQRFSNLIFSDVEISGRSNDLILFGHLFKNWGEIGLLTKDKKATVLLNGKERYAVGYKKEIGEIKGMIIRFKGCGKVDYVRLSDDKNKKDFEFNSE